MMIAGPAARHAIAPIVIMIPTIGIVVNPIVHRGSIDEIIDIVIDINILVGPQISPAGTSADIGNVADVDGPIRSVRSIAATAGLEIGPAVDTLTRSISTWARSIDNAGTEISLTGTFRASHRALNTAATLAGTNRGQR